MPNVCLIKLKRIDLESEHLYKDREIRSDVTLPGVIIFRRAQAFYRKYFALNVWDNDLDLSRFVDHRDWDLSDCEFKS